MIIPYFMEHINYKNCQTTIYVFFWFLLVAGSIGDSPSESELKLGDIGEFALGHVLSKPLSLFHRDLPFSLDSSSNEVQTWKPVLCIIANASIQAFAISYLWDWLT
ncbi:MAG: hypothetical protein ACI85I_000939 [Arenicella sp.]|jgi:hypothetical protein